jgi:leucyl aminopeptidase
LIGQLAATLPPGLYHLGEAATVPHLAAVAWGLGAYRFRRYKTQNGERPPSLKLPQGVDREPY